MTSSRRHKYEVGDKLTYGEPTVCPVGAVEVLARYDGASARNPCTLVKGVKTAHPNIGSLTCERCKYRQGAQGHSTVTRVGPRLKNVEAEERIIYCNHPDRQKAQ